MATTKTLTPTNQAITLAAFTEKPDNRTNVTNDDKLADAVNALNSKLTYSESAVPASDCQCTYAGVRFSRNGNVIMVLVHGLVNLPSGSTDICTIPVGFRTGSSGAYSFDTIVTSNNYGSSPRVLRFTMHGNVLRVYNYDSTLSNNNAEIVSMYLALV